MQRPKKGRCAVEPHERQYLDVLLAMAVDQFAERIVQRNGGPVHALSRLRSDPQGEGIWVGEFVDAFFRDSLLDTPAGSCLILQAFANRRWEAGGVDSEPTTIGEMVQRAAKTAFGALLLQKTEEALERTLVFGGD